MKKILIFIYLLLNFSCLYAQVPDANGILYVKKNAVGNGSAWGNEIGELADALVYASSNLAIKQIWVTGGIYRPKFTPETSQNFNEAPNDARDKSFLLVKDVKIYGGFAGNENSISERQLSTPLNKSILSGDLGIEGVAADNAYHVVVGVSNLGTAELNGFVVTGGNADGSGTISIQSRNFNRGNGGGVYLHYTSLVLENLEVIENNAGYGAGLFNLWASPTINNVKIAGNAASSEGGGIYNTADSRPIINNTLIVGNSAGVGGAMHNTSSTITLTNATIASNKAGGTGAMANLNSTLKFRNSIVFGNSANGSSDDQSSVSYQNSLVQGATVLNNGNVSATGITAANLFVDAPAFSTAPTVLGDFSLVAESDAINRGDNDLFAVGQTPDLSGINKDYLANPRLFDGVIDLGALEYQEISITPKNNILYVKKGSSGNGSSWTNAIGEVAEALKWANAKKIKWTAQNPLQIWVAGGTYMPLYGAANLSETPTDSRSKSFVLVKDVKLYGGFAGNEVSLGQRNLSVIINQSVLSGDIGILNEASDNVYHVVISASDVGTAELNGFIVSDGNTTGASGSIAVNSRTINSQHGAGMYNHTSSPKISHVTFQNNQAANGGGMFSIVSQAIIRNSRFLGNTAVLGAAMHNSSAVTLYNTLFSGNKATSQGGAVYNAGANPNFYNVTIAGNTAASAGAIFNNASSTSTIVNSIILGNSSAFGGSGVVDKSYSIIQGEISAANNNLSAQNVQIDNVFNAGIDASSAPTINGNYTLKTGAVVINMGNNAAVANTTDLNDDVRVKGIAVDLGAYEHQTGDTKILAQPNGEIVYVKQGSNGLGNSWAEAYGELADALVAAKQNTAIKQIWVAAGTYLPKYTPADGAGFSATPLDARDKTFLMVPQVSIYGGFIGAETDVTERTLTNEQTILSGDIGIPNHATDNVYHVVLNVQNVGNVVLDNLTITEGNASGSGTLIVQSYNFNRENGGGLYFINKPPNLNNVLVENNRASYGAGYCLNSAHATITNSKMIGNVATETGGAVYLVDGESFSITNTVIAGNKAKVGAAILNNGMQDFKLINSTIVGNYATDNSVIRNIIGATQLINSIVLGNSDGISNELHGYYTLAHSLVQREIATTNGNLNATAITEDAVFTNPIAYNNAPFFVGDYTVKKTSPTVNKGDKTVFNANQIPDLSTITTDLAGNPRIFEMEVDMGAYELQDAAVLPVTLLDFIAIKQATKASLKWETASEQNNSEFIISRSSDGSHFATLATLKGAGTTTVLNKYQFTDFNPLSGSNYYRLQQQDLDGKLTDLGLRVLNFDFNTAALNVYPNPVKTQVTVIFKAQQYHNLALVDITGRVLNSVELKPNQTAVNISTANLNAGVYLLKLSGRAGAQTVKVLKK